MQVVTMSTVSNGTGLHTCGWRVPSTRTLTSMGLSGLAKLSWTPAQHTGMLVVRSSVGGAEMSGGTSGRMERECRHVM